MPATVVDARHRNGEASETPPRQVSLRRDVPGLVLVGVTLLLLISVCTHNPADPIAKAVWPFSELHEPSVAVYPTSDVITNACGALGATLSAMVLDGLGIGVALLIAGGGGVATALLTRGSLNAPVLRSLGGCIALVGVCTAASMVTIPLNNMPVVGNGGYLGAMASTFLLEHFHPAGSWILTLTTLAIGLLMTTDYLLVNAGTRVVKSSARVSGKGFKRAAAAVPVVIRRRREPFVGDGAPILIDGDRGQVSDGSDEKDTPEDKGPTITVRQPKRRSEPPKLDDINHDATPDAEDDEVEEQWESNEEEIWEDDDAEAYDVVDSTTRELDVGDETINLRQDDGHGGHEQDHGVPAPKIKLPRRKKGLKEELDDAVDHGEGSDFSDYLLPSLTLLEEGDEFNYDEQEEEARTKSVMLEKTIRSFGYNVRVTNVQIGPVITQYEIDLESGLRLNKITALADDLAIAMRVPTVRIVAPIPGRNTVGIEVPNVHREVVRLRDVIEESDSRIEKMNIPVFLGKDVAGDPMPVDLAKMPHLLIAGRTGTGKSVCLNAIITSVLMKCRPDEVRMLMIDPKMVELSGYGRLPHLMHPVITDMKKAEAILAWAVEKMEERYSLLAKVGVRHINSFNDLGREEVLRRLEVDEEDGATDVPDKLPFIVIIADEMADLMMTAGKDVEQHIIRLAQKSRAVGIHLILATQKPTVDVITGLIKSNLPARLSFQVASKTDSRVVLDENGADKLLGNGDMLFLWPGTSTLIRGQGTYLSDAEIDRVVDHCSMGEQQFNAELMSIQTNSDDSEGGDELDVEKLRKKDELYESAIEVVIREGRGSLSLIQRCLGVGYGRAARLIDYMAEDGIVGQYNGSKSREVLITMDQWQRMQGIEPEENELEPAEDEEDYIYAGDDEEYEDVE
ncbi:MAG: DNA translocase FtsK 4TM domain-containing protein [Planctomycetota bacterium]